MGVLSEFTNAGLNLVKLGPKLDRTQRREMRDAVGELADELNRALVLTETYLAGAKNAGDAGELARHFRDAPNRLMQDFHEYKVCGGLYDLEDRFKRIFDPMKLSVSVGNAGEFTALIQSLSQGERMILDDLDELMQRLRRLADEIDLATPDEYEAVRAKALSTLSVEQERISGHKKLIKKTMREAFSTM